MKIIMLTQSMQHRRFFLTLGIFQLVYVARLDKQNFTKADGYRFSKYLITCIVVRVVSMASINMCLD